MRNLKLWAILSLALSIAPTQALAKDYFENVFIRGTYDLSVGDDITCGGDLNLAALTASRLLGLDGSKNVVALGVTTAEALHIAGVTSALCGINQSCTLTNKTLTSPTINGGTLDDPVLTGDIDNGGSSFSDPLLLAEQGGAPSTPASSTWAVYFKSTGLFIMDDSGTESQVLTSAVGTPAGALVMWFSSSAPSGWVLAAGGTIGSAGSSATVRANADTIDLYTNLWNSVANTELPIQDSGGTPTTRGASAAADFAANKRLPLPNFTGLVPRGTGTQALNGRNKVGPTIGGTQEDQMQGHFHDFDYRRNSDVTITGSASRDFDSGTPNSSRDTGPPTTDGTNGTPRTGTETRASGLGVYFILKL